MGFRNPVRTAVDQTARDAAAAAAADAAQAIADAADAQATADGKVTTYSQTDAPTGLTAADVGDLWFDTDDTNKLYRWSGTAWVASTDTRVATALSTAQAKVVTYYQAAAPSSTGRTTGDLWVDTDDGNKLYRWSGTAWVNVHPKTVDTGGTGQRVVLSATGGEMGGGSVLLYQTNVDNNPGRLESGSDTDGALARLVSPANTSGVTSAISVKGTEAAGGDEGVILGSTGSVYVFTATGKQFYVNGNGFLRQRVWQFNRSSANDSDPITVGSMQTMLAATILNAPAGDYLITWRCVVSNTTVQAGFTAVSINANYLSDGTPRADCNVANGRMPFTEAVGWTHPGGDATIRGHYQAAAGVASVWKQGTSLTIAYLGPRS